MKTIDSLFFELIQVSAGLLDCLSRGPEPEEWQTLYELSKQHHVEGISYQGVMKLFDFGLRAPQDPSLDWMAEAEAIREANETAAQSTVLAPCYDQELLGLRQRADNELRAVSQLNIQYVFQQYLQRKLDMRLLLDYYYVLRQSNGKFETLKAGGPFGYIGIRRFARGVMWMLQETLKLNTQHMPFAPLEKEGRFLLSDMMNEVPWWKRALHALLFLNHF